MKFLRLGLLGCLLLGCLGCSDSAGDSRPEEDSSAYLRGKRYLKEGRKDLALQSFLKVVESLPICPESHLELGNLLLNDFSDPVGAIYHYRKFLEQKPHSREVSLVRDLIRKGQLAFAKQLPGRPVRDEVDRVDLLNLLQKEREEKIALQEQLDSLENRLSLVVPEEELAETTVLLPLQSLSSENGRSGVSELESGSSSGEMKRYEVQPGDTLSRISQKFYGNSGRWMDLYQANRDLLARPESLRIGQVLKIPAN